VAFFIFLGIYFSKNESSRDNFIRLRVFPEHENASLNLIQEKIGFEAKLVICENCHFLYQGIIFMLRKHVQSISRIKLPHGRVISR
jgi:hypothetical protein